jgi:predicted ester cyclase
MGPAVQVIEQFYAAFNAQDVDGCRAVLDRAAVDGFEYRGPTGALTSPDEILNDVIMPFWRAFPDGVIETVRVVDGGDTAAVEHTYAGTHTGPLVTPSGEVPATGGRLTFDACTVVTVHGTAIRSWHGYYDQMAIAAQLGLLPATGRRTVT